MKRILLLAFISLVALNANLVQAQETPELELELVRNLRTKGWHELAKAKIDDLLKQNNPLYAAALPLELAKINIAIARQKDPEQRFALFTLARTQLQEFINKNKGKSEAAQAAVEIARLSGYHGQAILSKAMREDDARARHEKARPAETMFKQAGTDLEAALKLLDAAIAAEANPKIKADLVRDQQQARFDMAINIFEQAKTYLDKSKDAVNAQRSATIAKAKDAFVALANDESNEVGWLANAWLMKCYMEMDSPDDVNKYHDYILKRKDAKGSQPAINPAVRLVRYFGMQDLTPSREDTEAIGRNPKYGKFKTGDRLKAVQTEGEAWIKAYPGHLNSYEGQGVLFELAYAYMSHAFTEKDPKITGPLYDKALKYFDQLAEMDSDMAERARQIAMSIKFKRLDTTAELKSFDEYMMKAMIDRRAVIEVSQKLDNPKLDDVSKLKEEKKKQLKNVINSLNNALALATSKTPVQKIDDARYYLCGAYLAYGDPYRAAIVAESLGRIRPPTRRSSEGAATALATYAALQSQQPDDLVLRKRLQDMAQFILSPENKAWANESVASVANYHLAMAAKRDNKIDEAISYLEKLAPDFNDYIYTQGQIVFMAQSARERVGDDKKKQQIYIDLAKKAIARMPKLEPKNESSHVIAMYFFAKLEMPKFLYAEAMEFMNASQEPKGLLKCNEMAKFTRELQSEFESVQPFPSKLAKEQPVPPGRVTEDTHEQIQFTIQIMLRYSDLGIANINMNGISLDRFDKVIASTKAVVDQVVAEAKNAKGDALLKKKDYRVVADILGLALRANVQKGDVSQGKAILEALKRLTDLDGVSQGSKVVTVLLNDIAAQIRTMKANKQDTQLQQTKKHYTGFLDEIAKEYETKGIDNNSANMLGHAFLSLEFPCKAAALFAKIKPPADLDKIVKKKPNEMPEEQKARQAWEEDITRYWGLQIEYIRALRACKDKEKLAESNKAAEAVIIKVLTHPNGKFQIQASMERAYILEEQQKYREAYGEWSKIVKNQSISSRLNDPEVQKIFFRAYFCSTKTLYKIAIFDTAIKAPDKLVDACAMQIFKLETTSKDGWTIAGPMFQELLKEADSARLRKAYELLKQKKAGVEMLPSELRIAEREMRAPERWQLWRSPQTA